MKQLSPEWFEARRGKLTASKIGDIMPGARGSYTKTRADLMTVLQNEILGIEREAGKTFNGNDATAWGTKYEPSARSAYEIKTGDLVEELGLVQHPTLEGMAASPDGQLMLKKNSLKSNVHIRVSRTH